MRGKSIATNLLGLMSVLVCFTVFGGFLFALPGLLLGYSIRTKIADPKVRGELHTGLGLVIVGTAALLLIAGGIAVALSRPRPVGQLTPADLQMITNVIGSEIAEQITDIRPRDTVVVIDTGRNGVCYHCFYVERTRKGWKVTWRGT